MRISNKKVINKQNLFIDSFVRSVEDETKFLSHLKLPFCWKSGRFIKFLQSMVLLELFITNLIGSYVLILQSAFMMCTGDSIEKWQFYRFLISQISPEPPHLVKQKLHKKHTMLRVIHIFHVNQVYRNVIFFLLLSLVHLKGPSSVTSFCC